MIRVILGGSGLAEFRWSGPASHFKLFLPESGQHRVVLPESDDKGFMVIEPGGPRPITRTFTPRWFDPQAGLLAIDFVLHGQGAGSEWAAVAEPDDLVAVSQPRGQCSFLADNQWMLVAGDETAVPAISTLIEACSAEIDLKALIEIPDDHHRVDIPSPSGGISWLLPREGQVQGEALAEAMEQWSPPSSPGQVWVGCEAAAVRGIRRNLLEEKGMTRERMATRGYWRLGDSNHPDHDLGEG